MITRAEILKLIPHAGSMCLIDSVKGWDNERIECSASSHRAVIHPLRYLDRLSSIHLIEYAAQAAAVHGGLLAQQEQRTVMPGLLVALRDCQFGVTRLDDLSVDLTIVAQKRLANAEGLIYEFVVADNCGVELATGRLSVMMQRASS